MINRHWCISAFDEDSPYTNSCLFTLDRLPLLLLLRKNQFSSSPNTAQQSVRKPYCPLLVFNSPLQCIFISNQLKVYMVQLTQHTGRELSSPWFYLTNLLLLFCSPRHPHFKFQHACFQLKFERSKILFYFCMRACTSWFSVPVIGKL